MTTNSRKEVVVKKNDMKLVVLEVLFLCIALLDALYLTYHHYLINVLQPAHTSFCSINSFIDCDSVAKSSYSTLGGIPVSSIGIFAYTFVLFSYLFLREKMGEALYLYLGVIIALMLAFSFYELWVSVFVLKSICLMCCLLYFCIICLSVLFAFRIKCNLALNKMSWGFECLFQRQNLMKIALFFNIAFFLAFLSDRSFARHFESRKDAAVSKQKEKIDNIVLDSFLRLPKKTIDYSKAPSLESLNSVLTMVEFSDFQCPACAQRAKFLKSIYERYQGKLRIVFKHYPLDQACNPSIKRPFHPYACQAAYYAVCAHEQGKFWEFHDFLFSRKQELDTSLITNFANDLQLERKKLESCLRDHGQRIVKSDLVQAEKMGVDYTPSIYLEGRKISDIAKTADDFIVVIDFLLRDINNKG